MEMPQRQRVRIFVKPKYLRLLAETKTNAELAELLGVGTSAIAKYLRDDRTTKSIELACQLIHREAAPSEAVAVVRVPRDKVVMFESCMKGMDLPVSVLT